VSSILQSHTRASVSFEQRIIALLTAATVQRCTGPIGPLVDEVRTGQNFSETDWINLILQVKIANYLV
jgi:hypothetical protein